MCWLFEAKTFLNLFDHLNTRTCTHTKIRMWKTKTVLRVTSALLLSLWIDEPLHNETVKRSAISSLLSISIENSSYTFEAWIKLRSTNYENAPMADKERERERERERTIIKPFYTGPVKFRSIMNDEFKKALLRHFNTDIYKKGTNGKVFS